MYRPKALTWTILASALILASCGSNEPTYEARASSLERLTKATAAAGHATFKTPPELRAVDELSPRVLWDAPEGREDWRNDTNYVLGRIVGVERGMAYQWLSEDAPRDSKYGDGVPKRCTQNDVSCTTAHLIIEVERSFPRLDAKQITVGAVTRTDFKTFAEGMLALGQTVFVTKPNWQLFVYDPDLRTVDLDNGAFYKVDSAGQISLPFADGKIAAESKRRTPNVEALFQVIQKDRTVPLRATPGSTLLVRSD